MYLCMYVIIFVCVCVSVCINGLPTRVRLLRVNPETARLVASLENHLSKAEEAENDIHIDI